VGACKPLNGGVASGQTWRFSLATRGWTELTAAQPAGSRPSPRLGATAAAADGGFYMLGRGLHSPTFQLNLSRF